MSEAGRLRAGSRGADDGITLVEVLIAMAMTLIVLGIVASSFLSGSRLQTATSAEADGLTDLRTTVERLGRDVRAARGIDPNATSSTLSMWIDFNSDYIKQTSTEVVTWALQPVDPSDPNTLYDVTRKVGTAGSAVRQSGLVWTALAFTYLTAPGGAPVATPLSAGSAATVRIVAGNIEYSAERGNNGRTRRTTFAERLRNVK